MVPSAPSCTSWIFSPQAWKMAQLVADNLDVVPGMQGMQVGSWSWGALFDEDFFHHTLKPGVHHKIDRYTVASPGWWIFSGFSYFFKGCFRWLWQTLMISFLFFSFGLLGVCMMFLQKAGATCSPKSLEKNLSCRESLLQSGLISFLQ